MKPFAISFIALCSAFMLAVASYVPASSLSAPDPRYGVIDLSWAVQAIPGNESSTIFLNGTVQEVYQQLNDTNPDYMNLLNKYWASNPSMKSPDSTRSMGAMDDRYYKVCTKRWGPSDLRITYDVLKALHNLKSRPATPPGPGSCGRISCLSSRQVWWCNDVDERKEVDSWHEVASALEEIARQCFWNEKSNQHMHSETGGQIFESGGWNVVVRSDDASC